MWKVTASGQSPVSLDVEIDHLPRNVTREHLAVAKRQPLQLHQVVPELASFVMGELEHPTLDMQCPVGVAGVTGPQVGWRWGAASLGP